MEDKQPRRQSSVVNHNLLQTCTSGILLRALQLHRTNLTQTSQIVTLENNILGVSLNQHMSPKITYNYGRDLGSHGLASVLHLIGSRTRYPGL